MASSAGLRRATCPTCGQAMIYTAFIVNGQPVLTWVCNCVGQPDFILTDVENARLDPNVSLVYELEVADG